MPLLGELYNSVTARENAVFWWVGDEDNWENVYCAFENGKMVAKGQVEIINIVPPGRSEESRHSIYLNLKTITEREEDYDLLESLYQTLLLRALELKETLSAEYKTTLCVGNNSSEIANTQFFEKEKGFSQYNSLFKMNHKLNDTLPSPTLSKEFEFATWMMETSQEEDHYLELEAEVWPDTPLGKERLSQFKQNPLWNSMVVRQGERIVGSLMVWQEEKSGYIENVFVLEPWRRSGIAKYMLSQALNYFRTHELDEANLMVLTDNDSALHLYESVGFSLSSEERRYRIELP
ncbi:GNAT family N-acetyltransferase [Paenibacillus sp. G2S3]|uniref:GNAT family N-acetyltransferase n=1 Tax=Paenibacillus sp. G2S3 TaxID=3047872 RepID=UPI0024C1F08D|nr:GNAT family N-acetyltransferase [Paenibacillus sp. G2S3]WHY22349.1 GNAT family N-acetyltransferase [Paenibacillus sp. G2S3]